MSRAFVIRCPKCGKAVGAFDVERSSERIIGQAVRSAVSRGLQFDVVEGSVQVCLGRCCEDWPGKPAGLRVSRVDVAAAVSSLFVNGAGERAERLVLTSADGRDLGGWCEGAIVDRLCDGLGLGKGAS